MKKILSLFAAASLVATTSSAVVSCELSAPQLTLIDGWTVTNIIDYFEIPISNGKLNTTELAP